MSTVFQVELRAEPGREEEARRALGEALDEVERIEALMSSWRPDSELSRINASAGGPAVEVDPELYELLERAVALCEATGGALDPSYKPLGRIWDYHRRPFVPPDEEAIAAARALVGCERIELAPERHSVRLPEPGMALGLGAIAKGYAVDRAGDLLVEAGFPNNLVDGGGDVRARGDRGSGPWRVGIQHPRERGSLMGRVFLRDRALVTSGDYERYAEAGGHRYGHILDPRTGRPAEGVISVSVMDETAERADGLATALFVLGPEGAAGLLQRFPGVDFLMVTSEGNTLLSRGFREALEEAGSELGPGLPAPGSSRGRGIGVGQHGGSHHGG